MNHLSGRRAGSAPRSKRVRASVAVIGVLIACVILFQARRTAGNMGLWRGGRSTARLPLASSVVDIAGGASSHGRAAANVDAPRDPRAPPPFLAAALPVGRGSARDAPGSHQWLTHQECYAAADESESCVYTGPLCTDGSNVYVSASDTDAAWPDAATPRGLEWPPHTDAHTHTACWDTRNLEATSGCGYSDSTDRRAQSSREGGSSDGGTFWTTPLSERQHRGAWGPGGSISSIVPLHWTVFADAAHAGPHTVEDPTSPLVRDGFEWEGVEEGDVDGLEAAGRVAAAAARDCESTMGAKGARSTASDPSVLIQWLDGPLWLTHMSIGWLGHPWHWSTAAFPLWTAKRHNATALHVPRRARRASQRGDGEGQPAPRHTAAVAHAGEHVGGGVGDEEEDDGSSTSELLLSAGGSIVLPPQSYVALLQGPGWDGIDTDGRLLGNLGDETPSRRGRGIGDMNSWQRGVWPLLTQPGVTRLLTRRTMSVALGVAPMQHRAKEPPHMSTSPRSHFDVARDACKASPAAARVNDTAHAAKLPRLMCSAHGGVLLGFQPRLFAGVGDANAFRVAAWTRAGVLHARALAEKADSLMHELGVDKAVAAAMAAVRAEGDSGTDEHVRRAGTDTRALAFLRGAKKKAEVAREAALEARSAAIAVAAAAAAAAVTDATNMSSSSSSVGGTAAAPHPSPPTPPAPQLPPMVKWWDTYPPRSITVVTRAGTRALTPQASLKALLRHIGLPVRWMSGLGSRPWDEQVAVLSSTGILLSAHGGDLANIPFLPPAAHIIEAFPYMMDHEGYRHLADATGARYTRLSAPPPTHPSALAPISGHTALRDATGAEPLPLPANDEDRRDTWEHNGFQSLFAAADFEKYCEDPQRVPSLDAALLVACNGRSKNAGVELDWPSLVAAFVGALDDIGCRPRQFTAVAARAIRAAQKEAGLTSALWEGWRDLAHSPPPPADDPLGLPPPAKAATQTLVGDVLRALGLEGLDLSEPDWREEHWGGAPDVLRPFHGMLLNASSTLLYEASSVGLTLLQVRLEEVHLVPVTGGDGWEGAQVPYINVRAKCALRDRQWRDRSPWA